MNIIAQYDSTVANAPAGYKTAVQAAISFIDHLISNPVTVPLTFSYGSLQGQPMESGALGESSTNGNVETYSSLVGYLSAAATSTADQQSLAALPAANPIGSGEFWVSDTQAKVFGLGSEAGYTDPQDGFVALSSKYGFSYDPSDRQVPGEYDAIGVLEHEITEALGRISDLGQDTFQSAALWSPLDLFRYSAAGQHDFNPAKTAGDYFSVDGQHLLLQYNSISSGADTGDWNNNTVVGDSFGAGYQGTAGLISPTDVLQMDVLGFTIALPRSTDFHNDGLSNLLMENTRGAVQIGEAAGGSVKWQALGGLGPEWTFAATGDFLGDGLAGFLIENTAGAVEVGEVGPDGAAVYKAVAGLGPEWKIEGAGDLLGNGKADVLIYSTSGPLKDVVQVGETDPLTGKMSFSSVGALGPEWKFVGVGDFLGEGHAQFLIENSAGTVEVADIVGGRAQYTAVGGLGPEWTFVGTGDFLGDGKQGFLIENSVGTVEVGEIAGGKAQYTVVAGLGPEWKFIGAGDYLGLGHAQFAIENAAGTVEVGNVANGTAQYTAVAGVGSEWTFHQ